MPKIDLALLWGHVPTGTIRCSRSIVRKHESSVAYGLARSPKSGRICRTFISSFGNFHLSTSKGPFPVSLVEILTDSKSGIPVDVTRALHCISIGYPIVGETTFRSHEKFYNPVLVPPTDPGEPLVQDWLSCDRQVINPDSISSRLLEYSGVPIGHGDSRLYSVETSSEEFAGENWGFNYLSNPHDQHVRSDRGNRSVSGKIRGFT